MSGAHSKPIVKLDLTSYEFKTVVRALTGDLNRTGAQPQELAEARELGLKLFDGYIRFEEHRLEGLRKTLTKMTESEEPEAAPQPESPPTITYLKPGSRLPETRMGHGKTGNYGLLGGQ